VLQQLVMCQYIASYTTRTQQVRKYDVAVPCDLRQCSTLGEWVS
jgi:hypothetical protein